LTFQELNLSKEVYRGIDELGFTAPTPIQERLIPFLLVNNKDIFALAQTGTGKTAAFGLPILESIDTSNRSVQVLILSPTRELCLQLTQDLRNYGKYLPGLSITPIYGGTGITPQLRELKKGPHILVATPGRLLDCIKRGAADINTINYLVLDEADIMLNMGFKEELDAILETAPRDRQTILLSATMPDSVKQIAETYMQNPEEIVTGKKNSGIETVTHNYFAVHPKDKYQVLKRIADFHPDIYGIIFCRTKIATQEIADKLINDGYNAEALHGDLSQIQREYVMKKFREGNIKLLVATDVASRGLDVDNLSHVIHYDLPDEIDVYTHRSGRTGRAGKKGNSLAIIDSRQIYRIRQIEKRARLEIKKISVPQGEDICEQQLLNLIDRVKSVEVDTAQIAKYMEIIEEKLAHLDRDELLKHFVSLEFNRFLQYYKNTPNLRPAAEKQKTSVSRSRRTRNSKQRRFTELSVNIGKKDRLQPPQVIGLVNQSTHNRNIQIGKIAIGKKRTLIEIENDFARDVLSSLQGFNYRGKKVFASFP